MSGTPPGPYVRLSVVLPSHPKLVGLSIYAKWAYFESICFSGAHLTDGHITDIVARSLAKPKVRAELLGAGLWEQNGDAGLVVHDYLVWNLKREDIEQTKKAQSDGGKRGAAKRWNQPNSDGSPHD